MGFETTVVVCGLACFTETVLVRFFFGPLFGFPGANGSTWSIAIGLTGTKVTSSERTLVEFKTTVLLRGTAGFNTAVLVRPEAG